MSTTGRSMTRCAIYTRKSSEEGLDQDFNSLDAQHEACAAYIASQRHEGWRMNPTRYDDGGLSGGTLERPALKRLLADIEAGRLDMVVVYKIDRLTRSLPDFARLVDTLDKRNCSFVSVTQAFNTSTSMGRLTLNVLLSFAQFEREVTAERIRDKIAASKKKGLWMGGLPPFGYQPDERTLKIVETEAVIVREIFELYRADPCLRTVTDIIEARGHRSRLRTYASGRRVGGVTFSKGAIHKILTNPIYAGRIRHKDLVHEGQHEAIIDPENWEATQRMLVDHATRPRRGRTPDGTRKLTETRSPLAGRLFDETGDRLTPSHSRKGERRLRYYISHRLTQKRKDPAGWRLSAHQLETTIGKLAAKHLQGHLDANTLLEAPDAASLHAWQGIFLPVMARLKQADGDTLSALVLRAIIRPGGMEVRLDREGMTELAAKAPNASTALAPDVLEFTAPFTLRRRGVENRIISGTPDASPDLTLIRILAKAHEWIDQMRRGVGPSAIAKAEGLADSYVRTRARFAFLSPQIQAAILAGRQPPTLNTETLARSDIPLEWSAQAEKYGFPSDAR